MNTITLSEFYTIVATKKLHNLLSWRLQAVCEVEVPKTEPYYPYCKAGKVLTMDDAGEEILIDVKPVNNRPLTPQTVVVLEKDALVNIKEKTTTTHGNIILNLVGTVPFDGKVPFLNGVMTPDTLKDAWLVYIKAEGITDSTQLLDVVSKVDNLASMDLTFIGTAAKREMFSEDKEKTALRNKLVDKHKDNLQDPLVQSAIATEVGKESTKKIKEMGADKFILGGKIAGVVLNKTEGAYGSELSVDGKPTKYVTSNLEEGMEIDDVPSYVNAARMGSVGRGGLTALGGADVNNSYLATSGNVATPGDCKTKDGVIIDVSELNHQLYVGQLLVGGKEFLTKADLKALIGKTVTIRVPGHCKFPVNTTCFACGGEELNKFPESIPTKVSLISSASMDAFMQATHGKQSVVFKIDLAVFNT